MAFVVDRGGVGELLKCCGACRMSLLIVVEVLELLMGDVGSPIKSAAMPHSASQLLIDKTSTISHPHLDTYSVYYILNNRAN